MARIIMLIPLDKDVGLTSITISLMHFFKKKIFYNKKNKSILYFSCIKNMINTPDDLFEKKIFKSISILKDINFSKKFFNSPEYLNLLDNIIEQCHIKKITHEFILIKGLYSHEHIDFAEINYDVAQNLNAEVIFIDNLQDTSFMSFREKEKKIYYFLKKKNFKNILGIIFNNVHSPFIGKKYSFIKKLNIINDVHIKKNKIITSVPCEWKNFFISIIALIPWSVDLTKIYTQDIYQYLKITTKHIDNAEKYINTIILFHKHHIEMCKKKFLHCLIIVEYHQINTFIDFLNSTNQCNQIISILLTNAVCSEDIMVSACWNACLKKNIFFGYTKCTALQILSQLEHFNFHIFLKKKVQIRNLQKYISSFFQNGFLSNKNSCITYSPREFCFYLKIWSRKIKKRIILPESYEKRILKAVELCEKNNIAQCVLLGNAEKIYQIAKKKSIHLNENVIIIDPNNVRHKYVERLLHLRKNKGMTRSLAKIALKNNIVLATLMLEDNTVDGLVAGSINTTADIIRPALQIIKTNQEYSLVSSIFFMLLPHQVLIYGDCAINIDPTAEELAEIAIQSADSSKKFGIQPRIAMLSYSTGFSGTGCKVEKVRNATHIVRHKRPDLIIDGPIQYDAAISEIVCKLKAPNSLILGTANVFIFPDLNSGNIAYKAIQRTSNIISIGPILQGLKKPLNDLSRGSTVEDIIYTISVTAIQSS